MSYRVAARSSCIPGRWPVVGPGFLIFVPIIILVNLFGEQSGALAEGIDNRVISNRVISIGVLPNSQGWILTDQRLFWSDDDGTTWSDDKYVAPPGSRLQAALFLGGQEGWLVVTGGGRTKVVRTIDAGSTWNSSLTPSLPGDDEPAEASLSFVTARTGYLMLRLASSSNFSRGALLRTEDGGRTWRLVAPPPIAGAIQFISKEIGWLAGGPAGSDLYVTRDGGRTWAAVNIVSSTLPPRARLLFYPPDFEDEYQGLLPVRIESEDGKSSVALYETHDGGSSWSLLGNEMYSGLGARPLDVHDHTVITTDRYGAIVTLGRESGTAKIRRLPSAALPDGFDVNILSFADLNRGWLAADAGKCAGFKVGCWREVRILRTNDGGATYNDVTPTSLLEMNQYSEVVARNSLDLPIYSAPEENLLGTGTRIPQRPDGFDKACYEPPSKMQAWWTSSPYWYVGVYIGGSNAFCVNHSDTCPCPPASWFSQTASQGWTFIPTWVGIQDDLSSYTPAAAFAQGVAEANAAADRMAALGFPLGSIVYYDFEDSYRVDAVKMFVNGWVSQLHARNQNAGIYGSYLQAAEWQGDGVPVPPDAIWPFNLNVGRTVFGLCGPNYCLPDYLWSDQRRIHQYQQNVPNEAWGTIALDLIDKNFADGPVATYGTATAPNTIEVKATLDGSPWPVAVSGMLSWRLSGPGSTVGGGVPAMLGVRPPGVYTLSYLSGGPTGISPQSISPAATQTLTTGGNLVFTFNFISGGVCTASSGLANATCPPLPTVNLSANPAIITAGSSSTLTWSSSNANSCFASGGWNGSQATSGSAIVSPSGTTVYTLTCSGAGGSATRSATITVDGSASPPAVYLSAFPQTVTLGTTVGLGWASTNAASCTASGGWSGSRPLSGGTTATPATTTTYTLTCTGIGGGSASASVTVVVTSPIPSVNLGLNPPAINAGASAFLQWSTNAMTSCTGSGGWSGAKPLSGSQQVSPASTRTYSLTCNGLSPTPQQLARNGSFSGNVSEWTLGGKFFANSSFGSCNLTCPGYAYLSDSSGSLSLSNNLFGTMRQDISLPGTANSITLSFWVSISTLETSLTTPFDVLSLTLQDSQGNSLQLIKTFSNLNAGNYRQTTFDLTSFKGQTIRLQFVGTTDATRGTIFRVDDVSVQASLPPQQYSASATLTVNTPSPPQLALTATPDIVTPGQTSTLSWTSSGTTSCTASDGWSGSKPTSGDQVVLPSVTTDYTLSCTGLGGSVSSGVTVVVQTLPAGYPINVSTGAADEITQTSALLHATANPNGAETSAVFLYGPVPGLDYTSSSRNLGASRTDQRFAIFIDDLNCGTRYQYLADATNIFGESNGAALQFETSPCSSVGLSPLDFYTVTPCRVADTRDPTGPQGGPALANGVPRLFTIHGRCGIPSSAKAVSLNATVVGPSSFGHLTLFPGDQGVSGTSTINFGAGRTRANNAILRVSFAGELGVLPVLPAGGQLHFIVDVNGYFAERLPPATYIAFTQGDPGTPGDGTIIPRGLGFYELANAISMQNAGAGLTVFVFPPSIALQLNVFPITAEGTCAEAANGHGIGHDSGTPTMERGVAGMRFFFTQALLQDSLAVLNDFYPGCNFTLDDLILKSLGLFNVDMVDAVAIGQGDSQLP